MITENKLILDACCGSRMMWFNKKHPLVVYMGNRSEVLTAKDSSKKSGSITIDVTPDVVADFTSMPFEDESFWHVVFDPPHLTSLGENAWLAKKYGRLFVGWENMFVEGFKECMRVLKVNGTLVFKWSEHDVPHAKVLELIKSIGYEPLYGVTTGRQSKTVFYSFIKR